MCLTNAGVGNYVSVRLRQVGEPIGYVMVRNRADGYAYLLDQYQVWLGNSRGAEEYQCGGTKDGDENDVVSRCGGQAGYSHVTVKQVGSPRYLSIAEVEVYRA